MKNKLKIGLRVWLLIAILASCGSLAVPAQAVPGGSGSPDYASARRNIQTLEAVIDGVLGSMFSNPFALVQKTKGVYLHGYGVTFNFLVNIHRAVVDTPFGKMRSGKEISDDEKKRRIEELKDRMVRVLVDHGNAFAHLSRDQSVTIVAFFEDRTFLDEENQNKTIVLRAYKRDLEELAQKNNRWKELKQRMEIIEY